MVWKGKPLSSWKNGSWAHGTGSHVFLKGKPLTSIKNGSWAHVGVKPLRNAGSKSKVQLAHRGWSLTERKDAQVGKNVLMADIFEQLNKSFNDNPWHADDESSISLRRMKHGGAWIQGLCYVGVGITGRC